MQRSVEKLRIGGRAARWLVVILVAATLIVVIRVPLLRAAGGFLVLEDSTRPGAAIVVLGGAAPLRAVEAASLYRAGWAPVVILVPGDGGEAQAAFRTLGVNAPAEWEQNREALVRLGVDPAAIVVVAGEAEGTLEELRAAHEALQGLHSSGRDGELPAILVTSPYHGRRVALMWEQVAGERASGIVRLAHQDPFDPDRWWQDRRSILAVVREYLGLLNLWLGFPVPPRV